LQQAALLASATARWRDWHEGVEWWWGSQGLRGSCPTAPTQWPRCYYEELHEHLVSLKGRVEDALYVLERVYNTMFGCVVANCGTSGEKCKGRIYCDATTSTVLPRSLPLIRVSPPPSHQ
jgi:hypothetical protein